MTSRWHRSAVTLLLTSITAAGGLLLDADDTGLEGLPPAGELSVVGLGDSVMAGTACDCAGPVAEYAEAWQTRLGKPVAPVDLGVPGDTTTDLLARLRSDPTTRTAVSDAAVVLVVEGANDLGPVKDAYERHDCDASCQRPAVAAMGAQLSSVLAELHHLTRPDARVVVAGYWNVFADGDPARRTGVPGEITWSRALTRAANVEIERAARSVDATYVDLTPVFLPGGRDPTPLLADDGDHPNAAGVRAVVAALLEATPGQSGSSPRTRAAR